jgi:hypothetical protein
MEPMPVTRIVRTKTERPFNPHRLLLTGAQRQLRIAKENKEKGKDVWEYDWLGAIVLSALSIEAIGNSYGKVLIPNWKAVIADLIKTKVGASPIRKLTLVAENRGITPDFNSHPWLTAKKLTEFRDLIAHPKHEHLELEEDCTESDYGRVFGVRPMSDVEEMITEDFADQSCDAVDQIISALNETLDGEGLYKLACDGGVRSAKILSEKLA